MKDRWNSEIFENKTKKMQTFSGGFVNRFQDFDPEFFELSPREVTNMNCEHRILLETAWETFEVPYFIFVISRILV